MSNGHQREFIAFANGFAEIGEIIAMAIEGEWTMVTMKDGRTLQFRSGKPSPDVIRAIGVMCPDMVNADGGWYHRALAEAEERQKAH